MGQSSLQSPHAAQAAGLHSKRHISKLHGDGQKAITPLARYKVNTNTKRKMRLSIELSGKCCQCPGTYSTFMFGTSCSAGKTFKLNFQYTLVRKILLISSIFTFPEMFLVCRRILCGNPSWQKSREKPKFASPSEWVCMCTVVQYTLVWFYHYQSNGFYSVREMVWSEETITNENTVDNL